MSQEQKIRDGTSVKTKQPEHEQHDVLLVANKEKKSIRVASDEVGKTDRFDKIKEDNPPFLKISGNNMLENFVSNYLRQSKNPTHFRFFRVPPAKAKKAAPQIREVFKDNPSKEMQEFVRQYEVNPVSQETEQKNKNNNDSSNNQLIKEEKMNTGQETQTMSAPADNTSKKRFNEAMINWEQLTQFGVSRDYLERTKMLDEMLKGYKTSKLVPVRANFGSITLTTDARLSFRQMSDGQIALAMHGIRKEPELEKPFYGHIFSEEDKKNIRESGHMGRQAMLSFRGADEKTPCLVSIDKLTNEIVPCRAESVFIPDEVCGVKLTDKEKEELREGKAVFVDGMISKKGNEFYAHLQINAEKRGIEYIFDNSGQFNRESIGGVELTKKQIEDLTVGKAIFVEDMKKKDGETFSAFIRLDNNGNPSYTRYNPDTPEGAREIYIPKEIGGVRLTHDDRETLRSGKPVFLENMVSRKGEEFSSFVKIDTETGKISYSRTEDGFDQKAAFKVPQEVWGVTLKASELAALQDGKAVHITGMKGFNGQEFSSFVKVNEKQGILEYYNENPDKPRQSAGQSEKSTAVNTETPKKPDKEAIKPEKTEKPAKTNKRKIS